MQLPRYRSQALPQEATISPATAASGAAAMTAALAGATGEIAGIIGKVARVRAEMEANRRLAEIGEEISSQVERAKSLANRPYLSAAEFGGMETDVDTPTHLVLEREWRDTYKRASKISLGDAPWSMRKQFEAKREEMLRAGALEIANSAREAEIMRARVDGSRAAQILQNLGNYDAARRLYDQMHQEGLIDYEARDRMIFGSHASQDENTAIMDALEGGKGAMQILADIERSPYLGEDAKLRISNRINSIYEQRNREQLRIENQRSYESMVELWSRIEDVTRDEVMSHPMLNEQHALQLMKEVIRRDERPEGDDPAAVSQANIVLGRFLTDASMPRERAIAEISAIPGLSADTVFSMLEKVESLSGRRFTDPEFKESQRQAAIQILGVEDPATFRMRFQQSQIADGLEALLAEFEITFFQAKLEAGVTFEPGRWFLQNIDSYRDRAASLMQQGTSALDEYIVRGPGGQIDREATLSSIRARERNPSTQVELASQLDLRMQLERSRQ